ncbi:MAG: DUF6580 family putative transport protein [Sphingomicrobium sp.]
MNSRLLVLVAAIVAAAALRLVPHPPNFTPVGAMALFSAATLGRRPLAFVAPFAAMLLSDAVLGFHASMPFVYLGLALTVVVGWLALQRRSAIRVGLAALASSVLFFLITNFGVWAIGGMYPQTLGGLAACYVAGIPFFQNSVAGDLFYAAVMFGGLALLERAVPALRAEAAPQPA